ncbi:unnamed protein product [Linum trigynum]|uniref:Uncharacterized protein n=1 Tax=Linum trigynum TaxID=586398 RepID=A0AAV2GKF6_9ROSI
MAPTNPQLHPAVTFNNKVRMFYARLKRGSDPSPSSFTTVVYHHEILVTPSLLAETLGLPCQGSSAATNDDFAELRFDYGSALESLTHNIGRHFSNMLSAGRLADRFKVMHVFITRILLPRCLSSNELAHPSDVWIMANARDWVVVCDVREDLRAQHVLARVDASVGRQKHVIHSGGEHTDVTPANQLVHALLDAASAVLDQKIRTIKSKELCSLEYYKAQIETAKEAEPSDIQEEEGEGVSDYESPPKYEF